LRAEFDNSDSKLFPNQFVNAQLLVKTLKDATTVPTSAVQRGAPGTFVYLINPDDTVSVRPINLGPTDGELTAVESGLAPGDRVVIDGADRLREGTRVTIPANDGRTGGTAKRKASDTPTQNPDHAPQERGQDGPKGGG
jgi:multidrug efflux system membrane fusion protein